MENLFMEADAYIEAKLLNNNDSTLLMNDYDIPTYWGMVLYCLNPTEYHAISHNLTVTIEHIDVEKFVTFYQKKWETNHSFQDFQEFLYWFKDLLQGQTCKITLYGLEYMYSVQDRVEFDDTIHGWNEVSLLFEIIEYDFHYLKWNSLNAQSALSYYTNYGMIKLVYQPISYLLFEREQYLYDFKKEKKTLKSKLSDDYFFSVLLILYMGLLLFLMVLFVGLVDREKVINSPRKFLFDFSLILLVWVPLMTISGLKLRHYIKKVIAGHQEMKQLRDKISRLTNE